MKSNPIQEERERCVKKYIPELFSSKYKSVLYVGANQKRQHFLKDFQEAKYNKIIILEAFDDNYKFLKKEFEESNPQLYKVIHGDIRNIEDFQLQKIDVVFFWHGIEHLPEKDIITTLKKLESKANKIIVLGMPFGYYKQGAEYGNSFEEHLYAVYPSFLEDIGYRTETLGNSDQEGSNITAWKYIK